MLAGPATGPLARDDAAGVEELAAPHAPRLSSGEGALEAGLADGAGAAERLGELDALGGVGEPDLRLLAEARRALRDGDEPGLLMRRVAGLAVSYTISEPTRRS